jgi:hypothetical protein
LNEESRNAGRKKKMALEHEFLLLEAIPAFMASLF